MYNTITCQRRRRRRLAGFRMSPEELTVYSFSLECCCGTYLYNNNTVNANEIGVSRPRDPANNQDEEKIYSSNHVSSSAL